MENFICVRCGTQFRTTGQPPSRCPICEDERQFIWHDGQEWTTLERSAADHHNRVENEAPQLFGIGTDPEFAIGQRALLLQSPDGNLLWDCISLLDDKTIADVNVRGGIQEHADRFLKLANARYQALARVSGEAQWLAVTDVTDVHDAAGEAEKFRAMHTGKLIAFAQGCEAHFFISLQQW